MGKSSGTTVTSQNTLDPQTQSWIQQVYGAATRAAGQTAPGVDPLTSQAIDQYRALQAQGNLGLGALAGDQGAVTRLMNPYMDNVVNRVQADQGRLNAQTINSVNDAATSAGAFGGSRHGIAEGVALADVNRAAGDRMAGLRAGGYEDAMSRAGTLANFGIGATGALTGLGDYRRNVALQDQTRPMDILKGGLMGLPYGTTQTQTQEQQQNPWNTAIGLGAMFIPGMGPLGGVWGGLNSWLQNRQINGAVKGIPAAQAAVSGAYNSGPLGR